MKAKEIAKYLAYADSNEEYVILKRKDLHKIMRLARKYLKIREIVLDKSDKIWYNIYRKGKER